MPNHMIFNGVKTYEKCPVCLEENVLVEHGNDAHGLCHLWDCPNPECDNQGIVIVGYDCPDCAIPYRELT